MEGLFPSVGRSGPAYHGLTCRFVRQLCLARGPGGGDLCKHRSDPDSLLILVSALVSGFLEVSSLAALAILAILAEVFSWMILVVFVILASSWWILVTMLAEVSSLAMALLAGLPNSILSLTMVSLAVEFWCSQVHQMVLGCRLPGRGLCWPQIVGCAAVSPGRAVAGSGGTGQAW